MNRKALIIEIGDCLRHAVAADGADDLAALQIHCAAGLEAFRDLGLTAKKEAGFSDEELTAPLFPEVAGDI